MLPVPVTLFYSWFKVLDVDGVTFLSVTDITFNFSVLKSPLVLFMVALSLCWVSLRCHLGFYSVLVL